MSSKLNLDGGGGDIVHIEDGGNLENLLSINFQSQAELEEILFNKALKEYWENPKISECIHKLDYCLEGSAVQSGEEPWDALFDKSIPVYNDILKEIADDMANKDKIRSDLINGTREAYFKTIEGIQLKAAKEKRRVENILTKLQVIHTQLSFISILKLLHLSSSIF
jgi:hypothetical protein